MSYRNDIACCYVLISLFFEDVPLLSPRYSRNNRPYFVCKSLQNRPQTIRNPNFAIGSMLCGICFGIYRASALIFRSCHTKIEIKNQFVKCAFYLRPSNGHFNYPPPFPQSSAHRPGHSGWWAGCGSGFLGAQRRSWPAPGGCCRH